MYVCMYVRMCVCILIQEIGQRMTHYKFIHNKDMSTPAVAQMLATMLYGKRFFPYYTNNIIGGIDADGKGAVYSFDPVGSYEREAYRAGGSASSLLQPLIDNQVGFKNQGGLQGVKVRCCHISCRLHPCPVSAVTIIQ